MSCFLIVDNTSSQCFCILEEQSRLDNDPVNADYLFASNKSGPALVTRGPVIARSCC